MPSSYSANLKIELQATGENSGTWGTITNANLGTALEQAVVGYGNPNYISDANLTLTYTDTNAAQTARALVLNVTSGVSLSATRELVVPTIQKQYIVQNNTTGSQSITVKTSAGTGITVPNGRKAHLYVDGTNVILMDDFVDINGGAIDGTPIGANSASTGAFTTLSASGTTTLSGLTASTALALDASKNVVSVTNTGTGNNVLSASPTLTGTIGAAAATLSGNLTLSGGTANGVLYLNGSKVATSGSALTFDGTQTFSLIATGNAVTNLEGSATNNAILRFKNGTTGALAGFYGNNSKELIFEANGTTEQMRLTSAGNLGIGTTSPTNTAGFSRQLQIEGTTAALTLSGTTGTGKYTLGVPGANAVGLWDNTASAYRWYVDSSGNVGIGTTAPVFYSGRLTVDNGNIALASAGRSLFWNAGGTGVAAIQGVGTDALAFQTSNSYTEQMRLTSTGLGIGTASPAQRLHISTATTYQGILINGNQAPSVCFATSTNTTPAWKVGLSGNNAANFAISSGAAATDAVTIDSSGNLGIGTASPGSKLHVLGSAQVSVTSGYNDLGLNGTYASASARVGAFRKNYDSPFDFNVYASVGSSGNAGAMIFWRDSANENARFDTSGNLGIGTSSPTALLDVNADTMRLRTARTPASAGAAGNAGDICWDATYLYICTATNTWRRILHATW